MCWWEHGGWDELGWDWEEREWEQSCGLVGLVSKAVLLY